MLSSLKKLFFKDTDEDSATSIPEVVAIAPDAHRSTVSSDPVTAVSASDSASQAVFSSSGATSPDLVTLSLKSVFARLPNSLSAVVQSQGIGFIALPAKRIQQELPKGSVKIPFGEIRRVAPPGTFMDNTRFDQVLVELPLDDILMRLHPSLLARRSAQKQIHISPDISNVFGPRGEGISVSAAPVSAPKPVVKELAPKPAESPAKAPISMPSLRMIDPVKPKAPDTTLTPKIAGAPSLRVVMPQDETTAAGEKLMASLSLLSESWPEIVRQEILEMKLLSASVALPMDRLEQGLKVGKIIFTWKQICDWMQPAVESASAAQDMPVELPLKIVAPLFMAKRRPASAQKKMSVVDIPDLFSGKSSAPESISVAPALKPEPAVADQPKPMPVVLPVMAAAPKAALPAIPMVKAPIVLAPTVTPAPVAATAPIALAPEPAKITMPAAAPKTKPSVIGEFFGKPDKQDWSPNDVVKGLATLPEIAGAFIAMQDGLLVAAELPSHLKGDTVAAFLPQIFGRMNQYTRELQLGAVSSLGFVAENVPWQIIKSGTIYLVALGKTGEGLPSSTLNAIAAELGRQIQ